MDTQTNHIVTLLNAKCEVVNKLYNICQKDNYGDFDTKCCLEEMYAKTRLIDRLDCYCFPSSSLKTTTNGQETCVVPLTTAPFGLYTMYSNSSTVIGTYTVSSTVNFGYVTSLMLAQADIPFTVIAVGGTEAHYTITTNCYKNNISIVCIEGREPVNEVFTVVSSPVCETVFTDCYNCIKDSDLPKMYEVVKKLG